MVAFADRPGLVLKRSNSRLVQSTQNLNRYSSPQQHIARQKNQGTGARAEKLDRSKSMSRKHFPIDAHDDLIRLLINAKIGLLNLIRCIGLLAGLRDLGTPIRTSPGTDFTPDNELKK